MTSSVKVPMVATARQMYEGRWLHSGEPFMASSEEDADDLVALRFAARVNRRPELNKAMETGASNPSGEDQEALPADERTDAGATATAHDQQDPGKQYKKNEYNHRSMKARK